ncbi:MAG: DUF1330 domain-containing protein [Alphaproteobacteria bacterium]|nr:DUF1330 domain-containing protein [Alphaproteobacteria bacterium]
MAAYLMVDVEVTDQVTYDAYRSQTGAVLAKYGGRFLVRGGRHETLEGDWKPHRFVVIEFADMAALKRFYDSPEYRPLLAQRLRASNSRAIAVEGL